MTVLVMSTEPGTGKTAVAPTPWSITEVLEGDDARYYLVLDR
jgi:hypothetical protein